MWRDVTIADLLAGLSQAEKAAMESVSMATGQADPLVSAIIGASNDARSAIAAWRSNRLGAGRTVPEGAVHHVVSIARWRVLTRLPVQSLATDARRAEHEDAQHWLDQVAAGKRVVEQPDTATTDSMPAQDMDVVQSSDRLSTRTNLDGF
jgi:phage gp36-like protein